MRNEEIAIAVALLWTLQCPIVGQFEAIIVCFDCLSAGNAANGAWTPATSFGRKLRDLQRWVETVVSASVDYRHVKAHSGQPLNELVDQLAKLAAQGAPATGAPPSEVVCALVAIDTSWLSIAYSADGSRTLPLVGGQMLRWTQQTCFAPCSLAPSDLVPVHDTVIGNERQASTNFEVKAATVNIQGLQDRAPYLEAQFAERGLNVICLQEAKAPAGVCHSKLFMRLTTAPERHFGVSIWVSKQLGIASSRGKPILVQESDLQIRYESPRLLILTAEIAGLRFVLFSAHCPHAGQREAASAFLQTVEERLRPLKSSTLIIGGLDLNGRPPPNTPGTSGDLSYGDPDDTGREAVELFQSLHMWLPSTYSRLHTGSSPTFCHPTGTEHRIDFIAVGGKAIVDEACSEVMRDVDLASARDDHFLVACSLRGLLDQAGRIGRLWRPRYDVEAMLTPAGRATISAEINKFRSPDWSVHPDEHCRQFTAHLQQIMQAHFEIPRHGPRASFIPARVWDRRDAKLRLKARTRHRAQLWQDLVPRAFYQWRTASDFCVALLVVREGLLYQLAAAAIHFASKQVRQDIRAAKAAFLHGLVLQGGDHAADILSTAKKAGIGGAKSRKPFRPMPHLLKRDGAPVSNRSDRDQVWLEHFGRQECGQILSLEAFAQQQPERLIVDSELEWQCAHVPCLGDLEDVLRGLPRHKAAGLDAIPGELLRAAPGPMSRALHPLITKSMLCLQQPLQWRGGLLFEAWKHQGSQSDVTSYRSLYVASVVGKTYHKLQRRMIQDQVEETLHEFHMGAKRHTPVVMPALYVLASQRAGEAHKQSSAVLFLDTHAAYYRLVRDLALGSIYDDATVVRLFQHFALDETEIHEMMSVVRQGGTFADNRAPDTVRHAAKDTHHYTWFVTPHTSGKLLCRTEAGSRPGESWADTVYSFIYSRILARIAEYASAEELLPDFFVDDAGGPFAEPADGECITGQDATWADDSAWPILAATPDLFLRRAKRLASIVLSQCMSHGMKPNLGRNKTALMFTLRGKGAASASQRHFDRGSPTLYLQDLAIELPVTNQYKHLGGLLDNKLHLAAEARRRLSIASQAFDKGSALLFLNSSIPLATRASLLQIAVTSTYHNLPIWIPTTKSWELLANGYTRLVRRLLSKAFPGSHLFRLPAALAHVITGCPPLPMLARKSRLSLLCSMCKAGPRALWASLQAEQTWFAVIRNDLSWLVSASPSAWPETSGAAWPEWWAIINRRTGWFKKQVGKGLRRDMLLFEHQQAISAALWALHKKAQDTQTAGEPCRERVWRCPPCQKSYKTKAALGAHFFKSHGRCARYRAVVTGSVCRACGRQYWSPNRLSRHLRDSPGCVATLRANRLFAAAPVPGMGSVGWRRNETEFYNPSTPAQTQEAMPPQTCEDWDANQAAAHRELCDMLLSGPFPANPEWIADKVRTVLAGFPLYEDEAKDLVEFVLSEIN